MLAFKDIVKLKTLYKNNENIIQYIKSNTSLNSEEAILHSYDLQAGSYIKALSEINTQTLKQNIGKKLGKILNELSVKHICEAGVGEATTLKPVLSFLENKTIFAFDISMSRLLYGQEYLKESIPDVNLFCAELERIPFADNSIECLYTYHSLEPNGGKEKLLLEELLRVTQKYLILIEPDYSLSGQEQKNRMDLHGYCKDLPHYLSELGAKVIHYEAWDLYSNPLNKASIIIVEKQSPESEVKFVSPISFKPLVRVPEGMYCQEDGYLFPIIKNIPVLMRKNAILISHFQSVN